MTALDQLRLFSLGHELETGPDAIGPLSDCSDIFDDTAALRAHMADEGYLYLPGFLDVNDVNAARLAIAGKLAAVGAPDPRRPSIEAAAHPDYTGAAAHEPAQKQPELESLIYGPRVMAFYDRFLGGKAAHYDYTWLRVVAPGKGTPAHCDIVYMGRGTPNLYTMWTPLGDVDRTLGGLLILEHSHHHQRLRDTYCRKDVDSYCTNKPSGEKDYAAFGSNGSLGANPPQVRRSIGGRWLTADYSAGDVVIFSAFLVHAGLDNQTDRIRLSSDSRYQLASEAIDERWIGDNPPAHGPAGKRAKVC